MSAQRRIYIRSLILEAMESARVNGSSLKRNWRVR